MSNSDYRQTLYENYSETFGGAKDFDPTIQWNVFEQTYPAELRPKGSPQVLDIGCGKGEWLLWMQRLGYSDLTGVDVAAAELQHFQDSDIKTISANALDFLEQTDREFDLIHAKDLFEHFTKNEAVKFLKLCQTRLKPGGSLWVLTFNAQSPLSTATRYGDFTHEIGVTPASIAQVIRATGLDVGSVHCYVPVAGGIKGAIRRGLFKVLDLVGGVYLVLRHGSSSPMKNIAKNSILPDLFAIASRKT